MLPQHAAGDDTLPVTLLELAVLLHPADRTQPAVWLARATPMRNGSADALTDDAPLKLGERTELMEEQLASRRG